MREREREMIHISCPYISLSSGDGPRRCAREAHPCAQRERGLPLQCWQRQAVHSPRDCQGGREGDQKANHFFSLFPNVAPNTFATCPQWNSKQVTGRKVPYTLAPTRAGDPPTLYTDPKKIKFEIGWQPRYAQIEAMVRISSPDLTSPDLIKRRSNHAQI